MRHLFLLAVLIHKIKVVSVWFITYLLAVLIHLIPVKIREQLHMVQSQTLERT